DLAHLPPDDPQVYAMLRKGDTIGVFQVESRALMATLPRMKPERLYDLVVEVAIIRPGPIVGQMVHPYLARRAGREPVHYAHPAPFFCALLDAWPMGFYHPATLVKDGQRHGVEFRPIDVTRSDWRCTIEDGAVRLGMRYVLGLGEEAARRLVAGRPLASVAEAAQRGLLRKDEVEAL